MKQDLSPNHWTDTLWRAVVTVLVAAGGIYLAWSLLRGLIGPLILGAVLIGILRVAVLGYHSRRDW